MSFLLFLPFTFYALPFSSLLPKLISGELTIQNTGSDEN